MSPSIKLQHVLAALRRCYGPRPWVCFGEPVPVLVETILSQNTNDANSSEGFRRLWRHFRSWNKVADAPVGEVEKCIRISGLSVQKAPRIQAILRQLRQERGKIELGFLKEMAADAAFEYLTSFKGVGPKTAQCVLLFSLNMPVFPVDTHIHRIAIRLGVLPRTVPADKAHERLLPMIPPADRYSMHVLLIEHGRRTCAARKPKCDWCDLIDLCPTGKRQRARRAPGGSRSRRPV